MSGKQAGSLESGKQNTNKKQKLSKRPISPGQRRRRRRRLTTNLLSVIMWHRETIQLNGKRARLFPRTATNLLDGLGRPFRRGQERTMNRDMGQFKLSSTYIPVLSDRKTVLPILHLRRVNAPTHSGPEWQQSAPKFSLASENILTYFARIWKLISWVT